MRKQFDIKFRPQIESGEFKVETRDGRRARIICWDRIDKHYPIIALAPNEGGEDSYEYTNNGRYFQDGEQTEDDLFIVTPEEELTEFEKELESFYNHHLQVCSYDNQGTVEDSLHDGASKLLALARKELEPEIKAEALKDLPRWKTIKKDDNAIIKIPHVGTNILGERMLYIGENAISISCLMKLPGFKEDENHE